MNIQIDTKTNRAALNFLKRDRDQLAWVRAQGNKFLEALAAHVATTDDFQQEGFETEMVRLLPAYPSCFVTYFVRNMIGENPRAHRLGLDKYGFVFPHPSPTN